MTKIQRKLLQYTGLLGTLLTLLIVSADNWGVLTPIDNWLNDQRAKYCQFFAPQPSDRVKFIDIDDNSLNEIGRWPWPREKQARVIQEIQRAGAKVVCLDILLSEPQPPENGVNEDDLLASVLKSGNRTLVPCSFSFPKESAKEKKDLVYEACVADLREDLELTPDQLRQRLQATKVAVLTTQEAEDYAFAATKEAMLRRLISDFDLSKATPEELRKALLPKLPANVDSPLVRLLTQEAEQARSIQDLQKFSRRLDANLGQLATATSGQIPISKFTSAARYGGFVDYLPFADGVVRTVPIWSDFSGRRFPFMGFAVACAMLGADPTDPNQVILRPDRILIHPPDGNDRVVPVTTVKAGDYGVVPMMMDVPWLGSDTWETMFGKYPNGTPRGHYPISKVWEICEKRDHLTDNNAAIDDAIRFMLGKELQLDLFNQYKSSPPQPYDVDRRKKMMERILADEDERGAIDVYKSMPEKELKKDKDGWSTLQAWKTLEYMRSDDQTAGLIADLKTLTRQLSDRVSNCAVYIGRTDTAGSEDIVPTSLHNRCPGVVVHGAITNAILTKWMWTRAPRWVTLLLTAVLGLTTTLIVALMQPWKALVTTVTLFVMYLIVNGIWLKDSHNILLGLAGPIVAITIVWAGCTLVRYILEQGEKARITRRFRSYVDPSLVNYYLENPDAHQLTGERDVLTMVFTDMAGFTALTERLGEGVVPVLNEYMGEMVPIIRQRRGYVNKFLGDGIMFFYNAPMDNPNHATDAVDTVLAMKKHEEDFNRRLREKDLPTIQTRFGVNTGEVIVGDAGSPDASDYTALGDNCNLASRLEGANKPFGSSILISQRTADAVKDKYLLRPVGRLRVKGKEEFVMTYEPLARLDEATEEQKQLADNSRRVFELFESGRFAECRQVIQAVDHQPDPSHKLFHLYDELCEQYLRDPPADFRGGIILSEK